MHKLRNATAVLSGLLLTFGALTQSFAQQQPVREITRITGELYRVQNNNHFTVFLVTDEGIILADPTSVEFSTWLKSELAERFSVPVRYVVYSHHHGDHSSGGAVFEDTAEFVGHENMLDYLALPPDDFVTFRRLPFREMDWENGMYREWLAAIRHWEAVAKDYTYISAGHGPLGNSDGVSEWRQYFEALEAAVAAAIAAGQTLDEMRASIELPAYESWAGYSWLNENVLAMYHFLTDTPNFQFDANWPLP